jgi:hypothetical protein
MSRGSIDPSECLYNIQHIHNFSGLAHVYERRLPHATISQIAATPPQPPPRWFGNFETPSREEFVSSQRTRFGTNRETVTSNQRDQWGNVETVTRHSQRNVLGGEQEFKQSEQKLATGKVVKTATNTERDFWGGRRETNVQGERTFQGHAKVKAYNTESNVLGSVCSSASSEQNYLGTTETAMQQQQNILGVTSSFTVNRQRTIAGREREIITTEQTSLLGGSSSKEVKRRIVLPGSRRGQTADGHASSRPGQNAVSSTARQGVQPITVTIPYHAPAALGTSSQNQAIPHLGRRASFPGQQMMQNIINVLSPRSRPASDVHDGQTPPRGRSAPPAGAGSREDRKGTRSKSPLGRMMRTDEFHQEDITSESNAAGADSSTAPGARPSGIPSFNYWLAGPSWTKSRQPRHQGGSEML